MLYKNVKKFLTFDPKTNIILLGSKVGGENLTEKKKMGRPTDDPKPNKVSAWVSDETLEILDEYCEKKQIRRPEGVRQAINHLKDKK